VCVIGDQVRRELFGFEPALGRPLKVNDQWLTVVGILAPGRGKREIQGVTLEGRAHDVYLPVTTAERRFSRVPLEASLDELVAAMSPGTPVQESAAVVATLLDRLHGGAADYTITVPEALLEQSRRAGRKAPVDSLLSGILHALPRIVIRENPLWDRGRVRA
jgi:putative ABC transport system permease protein